MRDLSAKIENKNQCSVIKNSCLKNHVTKIQHQNMKKSNSNINISKILHYPLYICCVIYLNI